MKISTLRNKKRLPGMQTSICIQQQTDHYGSKGPLRSINYRQYSDLEI